MLSDDQDALFAVDAGSNEISSFRVRDGGALSRAGTVSSGGVKPISLAVHDNLLYVLNTGDNTVSGFRITGAAGLVALPHTTHSLAAGANGAAAVRLTPDGNWLVVTERVSNRLEVFAVLPNGRLGDPIVSAANGGASFGFDITARNQPIVSETQGSVSSYGLARTGALTPITASIPTPGNATGSAGAGATPIDLDHVGSRFLYTLETGRGTIGTFAIGANGSLSPRPDTPAGVPSSGLQGIAAY